MYQNILVINLMHIGDLMLVTPVLRTLRANYPQARISLLADKKLADLVQYNKHIDECLLIDKKGKDDHFGSFFHFIMKLRKKHYDLVINLHRNERASALAAFSGAKKIVGYSKPGFSLFFDKVMPNLKAVKHQIHSHFDVLREAVGVTKIDDGGLEMWLPEAAEQSAAHIWQQNFQPGERVVALRTRFPPYERVFLARGGRFPSDTNVGQPLPLSIELHIARDKRILGGCDRLVAR